MYLCMCVCMYGCMYVLLEAGSRNTLLYSKSSERNGEKVGWECRPEYDDDDVGVESQHSPLSETPEWREGQRDSRR